MWLCYVGCAMLDNLPQFCLSVHHRDPTGVSSGFGECIKFEYCILPIFGRTTFWQHFICWSSNVLSSAIIYRLTLVPSKTFIRVQWSNLYSSSKNIFSNTFVKTETRNTFVRTRNPFEKRKKYLKKLKKDKKGSCSHPDIWD